MAGKTSAPRLFVKDKHNNTVLNWHRAPASFDASVIVYLYRHALELFLKEILIGRGGELIHPSPSPETVVNAGHSLTKLLPDVRRIFVACGWDQTFGSKTALTFDDFTSIVEEFEKADPSSFSFRYPIKKDLTGALNGHFTFSVRQFALIMDEVLTTLDNACCSLPEIANDQAEAGYEAWRDAMENSEPPDYEPE